MHTFLAFLSLSLIATTVFSEEIPRTKDGRMGTKCFPQYQGETEEVCSVTIAQLVITPERYHGKKVMVHGELSMHFEGTGVKSGDHKVWIQTDDIDKYSSLEGKHVLVQGTYNGLKFGHGGMWGGAIESPSRIEFRVKM
ncbi:hypothetical protein [Thalassomonas actiniarum]|uniref:Uncharacterized protein n=1 Tax=Thalassomonas actiniarum TaxID=485447 RepID=A0AAE9YXA3_9GAMM|nr:hypothetical protein [Thalassomonas actiniarum]WDE02598.1 hypothetical protein SG35_029790 [Thalassomonas actiniarum]